MAFDLKALIEERGHERWSLFDRHLNSQLVRVLRTIGYDRTYVRAEGAELIDDKGLRYLDLLSGWGVFALGRNHPTVKRALRDVLDADLAGLVQMDIPVLAGLLAEALLRRMPWLDKLFFCNSGTEAVEAAIKFARGATGRSRIAYAEHGFHGLTYGALSLNGDAIFRDGFGPLLGECAAVPFGDAAALEQALARRDVAAFIVEPIQGKGVNLPPDGYLAAVQRLCRQYGTLFVADEIQTGMGRTGRFVACEHWAVEPDMVLLAKALSGGFVPVGAVALRRQIFEKVFDRMDRAVVHGSTFAKNDLAMAAGLATLAVLDEERLILRAEAAGERLMAGLRERLAPFSCVKAVRGQGLMIAIEFGPPRRLQQRAAYALLEQASKGLFCQLVLGPLFREHRILAQVAGHQLPVIKLLPPLVIDEAQIERALGAFAAVVAETEKPGALWDFGRKLASQAMQARGRAA